MASPVPEATPEERAQQTPGAYQAQGSRSDRLCMGAWVSRPACSAACRSSSVSRPRLSGASGRSWGWKGSVRAHRASTKVSWPAR